MKNIKLISRIAVLSTLLMFMAACGPAQPITVTLTENACTLEGPMNASAKEFSLIWVIEDDHNYPYELDFVQMLEGKTLQDLETIDPVNPPAWVILLGFESVVQSGPITSTVTQDFTLNLEFFKGPAYILCYNNLNQVYALGPIEVK